MPESDFHAVQDTDSLEKKTRDLSEALCRDLVDLCAGRLGRLYSPIVETVQNTRSVLECLPDGVIAVDASGRLVMATDMARRTFGIQGDSSSCHISDVPGLRPLHGLFHSALRDGEAPDTARISMDLPGGRCAELEVDLHLLREPRTERLCWIVAVIHDVTAIREMTLQLAQASKMASLGTMLACIVHDLNNPIANILGFAELLKVEVHEGDAHGSPEALTSHASRAETIASEALRAKRIIENCLAFTRLSRGKVSPVDVNRVVTETLHVLSSQIKGARTTVETDLAGSLPTVFANPSLLQQAIFNVAKNSVDAMPEGGAMFIRTRVDGDDVLIEIEDQGPGIPEHVKDKLFVPFVTTKAEGQGTGLGLSLTRTILEEFGGSISCLSEEGLGATFSLRLPRDRRSRERDRPGGSPTTSDRWSAVPDAPGPVAERESSVPARTVPRVFVIDDEPLMLTVLRDTFKSICGISPRGEHDPTRALERLREEPCDIVFLDLQMPGIDPVDAFQQVRGSAPSAKIVTMAASERPEFVKSFLQRGATLHLKKPFGLHVLKRALSRLWPSALKSDDPLPVPA